ncbi:hypothetical protein LSTR_LSTR004367 [Laodelphax striatellus]|uniref:PH domain-containing protein n=1 Tax=Laodelphax striatellus TaxID=195883 RepID=A0A482X9S7_LAOST|nr:hypothetical protein LSTR_LSTR004367 [Laodelphax striatellus]
MLVDSGSASATPSILDSPTLARVERARLRQEAPASYCQSLLPEREMHAIKKGLLWQQRERLFSRWKERYFILTRDYLHCFKRSSGPDKISQLGQFLFKIKLVEVEKVEWINKKSYSTIGITLQARDSRILLRATVGLEDWFELLEECTMTSKERRRALRRLWPGDNTSLSSNLQDWLHHRNHLSLLRSDNLSDSVPDLDQQTSQDSSSREEDLWRRPNTSGLDQRLSLLTDIDINRCDAPMQTPPPSIPSTFRGRPYKLNSDIFFMSTAPSEIQTMSSRYGGGSITPSIYSGRSMLTPVGSFRSGHFFNSGPQSALTTQIKYRDRSQSDAFNWKSRTTEIKNHRSSYIMQATHV